ncbi:MAG: glycosyltransferase family 4 protein [Magnetococcales bacterium]|nr:glycosyltransferase family 4 protein [Magnetococcales bacterium]
MPKSPKKQVKALSKRLSVVMVTADFPPNIGGVATHVVELSRALAGLGHTVHILTLPLGEPTGHTLWNGLQLHRYPIPKPKPFFTWVMRTFLKRLLDYYDIDLVHVHGLRPLEATAKLPFPVIFTNHTSGFLKRIEGSQWQQRRMLKRMQHCRHVISPSEELDEATRMVGYKGSTTFISNGVDVGRFTPGHSPLRESWGVAEDETAILLARRLVEKNGVTVFAEATKHLQNLPVKLILAGGGEDRAKVESILTKNGMMDRARLLGDVANDRMPEIYRAVDLSVLPSRKEATSITGLESMASGLPLVGTNVGGIPTLVEAESTGILVPPDDADALGNAMARLVNDPEKRRTMGEAARQRAVEQFSWRRAAKKTVKVYRHYIIT